MDGASCANQSPAITAASPPVVPFTGGRQGSLFTNLEGSSILSGAVGMLVQECLQEFDLQ